MVVVAIGIAVLLLIGWVKMPKLVAAQDRWMLEEEIAAERPTHRVRDSSADRLEVVRRLDADCRDRPRER
jgi:hypothetical protein